jgi:hypothetical protein
MGIYSADTASAKIRFCCIHRCNLCASYVLQIFAYLLKVGKRTVIPKKVDL